MARQGYKGKRKPQIELPSLAGISRDGISREKLIEIVEKLGIYSSVVIPIAIFDNEELSALEAIVRYLKENLRFRFSEIAELLNRDERNIWTTYRSACLKRKEGFEIKHVRFFVPITILQNRKRSVLESIVEYLKDERQCSLHDIAVLLNRDDRTIWTVYHRAQKKRAVLAS